MYLIVFSKKGEKEHILREYSHNANTTMVFDSISRLPTITMNFYNQYKNRSWDTYQLSRNPGIITNLNLEYYPFVIIQKSIVINPNFTLEDLLEVSVSFSNPIEIFHCYSRNPNFVWEDISDWTWKEWDFRRVSGGSYNRSERYRICIIRKELCNINLQLHYNEILKCLF